MKQKIGSGDDGHTDLHSGRRIPKNHDLIQAIGNADQLGAMLGMVLAQKLKKETRMILESMSHMVYDIGAEIASEGKYFAENISDEETEKMTRWIEHIDHGLQPIGTFIVSSGVISSEWLHLARSITRRLERSLVVLLKEGALRKGIFAFINRFSRLLFSLARFEAEKKGKKTIFWEKKKRIPVIEEKRSSS